MVLDVAEETAGGLQDEVPVQGGVTADPLQLVPGAGWESAHWTEICTALVVIKLVVLAVDHNAVLAAPIIVWLSFFPVTEVQICLGQHILPLSHSVPLVFIPRKVQSPWLVDIISAFLPKILDCF